MFKKWRSYVSLLVCSCCILSGLYLNTLGVRASSFYVSNAYSSSSIIDLNGDYMEAYNSNTNYVSRRTHDFDIPIVCSFDNSFAGDSSSKVISKTDKYNVTFYLDDSSNIGFDRDYGTVHCNNIYLYYGDICLYKIGDSYNSWTPVNYRRGFTVYLPSMLDSDSSGCTLEFHVKGTLDDWNNSSGGVNSTLWKCRLNYNIKVKSDFSKSTSNATITTESNSQEINDNTESIKNTNEDTNTTTHNIFDKISDFFGSFFENIKNALVSVFVPEDGYFSNWFDSLNTLLSDKLGILYYPFDLTISFLNRLYNAFSSQPNNIDIVFPAIKFRNAFTNETYTFLDETNVNLPVIGIPSSPNSSVVGSAGYNSVTQIIRRINSFIIVGAFIALLTKKLRHIIGGDE